MSKKEEWTKIPEMKQWIKEVKLNYCDEKCNNILDRREYLENEVNEKFYNNEHIKKLVNYLIDKLDFNNDIHNYMNDYDNFNDALRGMLIDNVLEKWEEEKQESKGQ